MPPNLVHAESTEDRRTSSSSARRGPRVDARPSVEHHGRDAVPGERRAAVTPVGPAPTMTTGRPPGFSCSLARPVLTTPAPKSGRPSSAPRSHGVPTEDLLDLSDVRCRHGHRRHDRAVVDRADDLDHASHVRERVGDLALGGVSAKRELVRLADERDGQFVDEMDVLRRGSGLGTRPAQRTRSSSEIEDPAATVTHATGTSPECASGRPTAFAPVASGCDSRAPSITAGSMLCAAADEVLGPAAAARRTRLVHGAEVAGLEPAVAQLAKAVEHEPIGDPADDIPREDRRPWMARTPVSPAGRSTQVPSSSTSIAFIRWYGIR